MWGGGSLGQAYYVEYKAKIIHKMSLLPFSRSFMKLIICHVKYILGRVFSSKYEIWLTNTVDHSCLSYSCVSMFVSLSGYLISEMVQFRALTVL